MIIACSKRLSHVPYDYRTFRMIIACSKWLSHVPYDYRTFHKIIACSKWLSHVPYDYRMFHMIIASSKFLSHVPCDSRTISTILTTNSHYSPNSTNCFVFVTDSQSFKCHLYIYWWRSPKRGKQTELTGIIPLRRRKSAMDCRAIEEEEVEKPQLTAQSECAHLRANPGHWTLPSLWTCLLGLPDISLFPNASKVSWISHVD
jgi:hypothetical protein